MNKVFKVIWSKTKNCYVVASELAKSHTKAPKSSVLSRTLVAGVLACVCTFGAAVPSYAAIAQGDTNPATGGDVWDYLHSWTIGIGANSNPGYSSVAIGPDSSAGYDGTALGPNAHSNGYSVAVGYNTSAENESIVVGNQSVAGQHSVSIGISTGYSDLYTTPLVPAVNAVSIGYQATTYDTGVSIGYQTEAGANAVAIGKGSSAHNGGAIAIGQDVSAKGYESVSFGNNTKSNAEHSIAIGKSSVAGWSNQDGNTLNAPSNAVAIGSAARAIQNSSVALGWDAVAGAEDAIAIGTNALVGDPFTTDSNSLLGEGSIAIGREASATGVNSVAIGKFSKTMEDNVFSVGDTNKERRITNVAAGENPTDAVNVSQLNAAIAGAGGGGGGSTPYVGINSAAGGGNEDGSGAVGNHAIAIGADTLANGASSIAIGKNANTRTNTTIAIGVNSLSNNYAAIAIGTNAVVKSQGGIAIGSGASIEGSTTNITAIGASSRANGRGAVSLGHNAYALTGGLALGQNAVAGNGQTAIGADSVAEGTRVVSVGHKAGDTYYNVSENSTVNDFTATYTEEQYDEDLFRRIINVADGSSANDAATVGQTIELVAGDNVTVVPDDTATNSIGQKRYKISAIGGGASYSAGDNISIENNIVSATGLVKYDNEDKDVASLEGVRGTKLTNLKAANLTQASTDAVIGNQLWSVKQDIIGFASDINRNKANITTLNQSVTDALSSVSAVSDLVDAIDSLKADASLNNLSNQGKAVIATAATDAVQAYMAEHGGSTGNTQTRMMSRSLGAVNLGANSNYVLYDDADSTSITLEGPVGEGTKLTGLAEAELSASSTDAVTGGQLYAVEQKFNEFQSALSENNSTIANMQTNVNNLKTKTFTMESDLNTAKTQLETGFNVTVDGAKVKTVNPEANFIDFKKGDNISITADGDAVKISAVATGTVAEGDTGLVSGDTVYQAIKDLGAGDVTQDDLKNYAKKDASNVAEHTAEWGTAIGTGVVEQDNGELVTGGTVFTAIDNAVSDLQDAIDDKANADLDNLTEAGKEAVKDLAKDAVKVEGKGAAKVTSAEKDGAMVYTVNVETNGKVEEGNAGIVTGGTVYEAINDITGDIDNKADKDLGNITDDGKEVIREVIQGDLDKKADKDSVYTKEETDNKLDAKADKADLNKKADKNGANITNPEKWAEKLGIGAVEEGNGNLVTGDTVAKALAEIDGTDLIDQNSEAIQIGAKAKYDGLDSVDISKSDGSGRVLRGVLVDPDDDNSAANVGYVKATAETIVQGVNAGLVKLDDKINKTGASAAAMANLHPVENDGDQRWNVAVGVGTFHGSTAGAVGVFYKPNENTMVNVSTSFGSENMFGAGVAFAIDKPTTMSLSKVQMARVINNQAEKLDNAIQVINKQQAQLDAQSKQIAELQAAVNALRK